MSAPDGDGPIELEHRQLLSASWLLRLARDSGYHLPQTGTSGATHIFSRPDGGFRIDVTLTDRPPWITATASDSAEQTRINELVRQSGHRVAAGDFGGFVWYSTTLEGQSTPPIDARFMARMLEALGSQTRIQGWRRLGWHVVLNFREELPEGGIPEGGLLFAPKPVVDVHLAVPGPAEAPFTSPIAHRNVELVGAICTFALGRPVDLPSVVFPADDEDVAGLETHSQDLSIPILARNGVSLDIFNGLLALGGLPSVIRARGAFLSYDAAVRQEREQVAVILYVVATECLTNPFQPWKKDRLTKRFVTFHEELMPQDLDEIVQHANFEQAFAVTRGNRTAPALRRELLSRLYTLRSEPMHEGLSMSFEGMAGMASGAGLRRALASDFAQKAIIRFLQSPRTSLIGHPAWPAD